MTWNAPLAALSVMALVIGGSPATALPGVPGRSAVAASSSLASQGVTGADVADGGAFAAAALSGVASQALTWASNEGSDTSASYALGSLSPAAQTEKWALVPEPVSWALLILGFGCLGWILRTRRRSPARNA